MVFAPFERNILLNTYDSIPSTVDWLLRSLYWLQIVEDQWWKEKDDWVPGKLLYKFVDILNGFP